MSATNKLPAFEPLDPAGIDDLLSADERARACLGSAALQ